MTVDSTDGGFFAASQAYGHDRARTHAALQEAGQRAFLQLMREAAAAPEPADSSLLRRIHKLWFEDAFPTVAGTFRREVVISRRPKVSAPHAISNDVAAAFFGFEEDWVAAGGDSRVKRISNKHEFHNLVCRANRITVQLHHIHPFLDGNTRACLTLRAYLLVRAGLPPVTGGYDEARGREAWNKAAPYDHVALDQVLYDQLADAAAQA